MIFFWGTSVVMAGLLVVMLAYWMLWYQRTSRELRSNQSRLTALFEGIDDAVFVHDEQGRILDCNQAACKRLGYSRQELLSMYTSQIDAPEFAQGFAERWAQQVALGQHRCEGVHIARDGRRIDVDINTSLIDYQGKKAVLAVARDITERKQAEQALRESERKLRMIFDNAFEGIAIYQEFPNRRRKLIDCNNRYAEMAGRSKAELLASDNPGVWQTKVSPERTTEQNLRLRREHIPYTGLFSWIRPDGAPNIIEYAAMPIDLDERPLTIGFDRDITDFVLFQQALRREHELVSRLMETSPAAIVFSNLQGEIVFANARAEALLELKRDAQTGAYLPVEWRVVEYQPPYSHPYTPLKQVHQTGQPVYNILHTIEYPDGRRKNLLVNIAPLFDSESALNGQILAAEDITERVRFEQKLQHALEELAHSEEKLRLIFDHAFDGISIYEEVIQNGKRVSRRLIECNSRYAEIAGRSKEELLAIGDTRSIQHDIDSPLTGDEAAEQLLYRGKTYQGRFSWLRPDGRENIVEYNAVPIQVGDKILIIGIDRDITEQLRAEAERRELREKLERAQRMEAIGVLAGGVAHDLNNILGPMVAYPELILDELPPDSPLRDDILQIQSAAERAAAVVQDLLVLARRGVYRMQPLNLNNVIKEYLNSASFAEFRAHYPNVSVQFELEPRLLPIHGSGPHLSKVIMNLVNNAFEAMPHGGILTISTRNVSLDRPLVGYERIEMGDYVVLQVGDTGIGIEERDIDKIFEPFYTKKVMGRSGSGLGLSVVYGVVHDHNGKIDLHTQVGHGTDFILYFPITHEEISALVDQQTRYRGTESILVVDDLDVQRDLARRLLESLGYTVTTVENGHRAIEYLRQQPVDLVLLDMIMEEGFDGLDTYREIVKLRPEQKVVIASGFSETVRVKEAQQLGAGRFVKKPYTLGSLGEAIRAELDR